MSDKIESNSSHSDFADMPYEIKKWRLEYEILNQYIKRLKEEIDIILSNINELKNDQS
jgi:hypothetical protein